MKMCNENIVKRAYQHEQSARHLSAIVTVSIIQMILAVQNIDNVQSV